MTLFGVDLLVKKRSDPRSSSPRAVSILASWPVILTTLPFPVVSSNRTGGSVGLNLSGKDLRLFGDLPFGGEFVLQRPLSNVCLLGHIRFESGLLRRRERLSGYRVLCGTPLP